MSDYSITRQQVLDTANNLRGVKFLHQGRTIEGLDCVGMLVYLGRQINYPWIFDIEGYRRTPSADTIRERLTASTDEIPIAEALPGDIFLMKLFSCKPRHAALFYSAQSDTAAGIEPSIIHASAQGVRLQPLSDFPPAWFVAAFRLRGVE